jgi:hypothetical protein
MWRAPRDGGSQLAWVWFNRSVPRLFRSASLMLREENFTTRWLERTYGGKERGAVSNFKNLTSRD